MARGLLRCSQKDIVWDILLEEVSNPVKVQELRVLDKVLLLHGDYAKEVGMGVWGSLEELKELESLLREQELTKDLLDMLSGQLVGVLKTRVDSSLWSGYQGLAYLKEGLRSFLVEHRSMFEHNATLILSVQGALTVAELGDLLDVVEEEVQLHLTSAGGRDPLELIAFLLINSEVN